MNIFPNYSQAPHLAPQFSYLKSNTDKLRAYITQNHGSVSSVYKSGQYPSNSLLYKQMLDEDKKKKEQDEEKVKTLANERGETILKRKKALDSRLEDINKEEDVLKHIEDLISRTEIKAPELIKSLRDWKTFSYHRGQSYHKAGTLSYEDESANKSAVSNAKNYTIYYATLVFSILQHINEVAQLFITNKTVRDELMEFFGWEGLLKNFQFLSMKDVWYKDLWIVQEKINTGKVITIAEAETFIKKGMEKHEKEEIINVLKMRQEEPAEEFNEKWKPKTGGKYSKRSKSHKKKTHKKRAAKLRAKTYRKTTFMKGRAK